MSEKFEVGESPGEKTPSQRVEKLDVREIRGHKIPKRENSKSKENSALKTLSVREIRGRRIFR